MISSVTLSWVTLGLDLKTFGWSDSNFLDPSFGHPLHPVPPMRTKYFDTKMYHNQHFHFYRLCHYSDVLYYYFDWILYFRCKQLNTIAVRNQSELDLGASQPWIEANLRQLSEKLFLENIFYFFLVLWIVWNRSDLHFNGITLFMDHKLFYEPDV